MSSVRFWIPGDPGTQPRPRVFRGGGVEAAGRRCAEWKASVRGAAWAELLTDDGVVSPFAARGLALEVRILFVLVKGRKLEAAPRPLAGRPDLDNLAKPVLDALQQARVYRDDGQIARLELEGWIGARGDAPGALVELLPFAPLFPPNLEELPR